MGWDGEFHTAYDAEYLAHDDGSYRDQNCRLDLVDTLWKENNLASCVGG